MMALICLNSLLTTLNSYRRIQGIHGGRMSYWYCLIEIKCICIEMANTRIVKSCQQEVKTWLASIFLEIPAAYRAYTLNLPPPTTYRIPIVVKHVKVGIKIWHTEFSIIIDRAVGYGRWPTIKHSFFNILSQITIDTSDRPAEQARIMGHPC